jgi:hypothetical protein
MKILKEEKIQHTFKMENESGKYVGQYVFSIDVSDKKCNFSDIKKYIEEKYNVEYASIKIDYFTLNNDILTLYLYFNLIFNYIH